MANMRLVAQVFMLVYDDAYTTKAHNILYDNKNSFIINAFAHPGVHVTMKLLIEVSSRTFCMIKQNLKQYTRLLSQTFMFLFNDAYRTEANKITRGIKQSFIIHAFAHPDVHVTI